MSFKSGRENEFGLCAKCGRSHINPGSHPPGPEAPPMWCSDCVALRAQLSAAQARAEKAEAQISPLHLERLRNYEALQAERDALKQRAEKAEARAEELAKPWRFIGPCAHGRDPYDRCDICGEVGGPNDEATACTTALYAARDERDALKQRRASLRTALAVVRGHLEATGWGPHSSLRLVIDAALGTLPQSPAPVTDPVLHFWPSPSPVYTPASARTQCGIFLLSAPETVCVVDRTKATCPKCNPRPAVPR